MPVEGGEETAIVNGPLTTQGWELGRDGIYFAVAPRLGGLRRACSIRYLDFESGEVSEVYREEGPAYHRCLNVSPGEEWIIHCVTPARQSELMLVEIFR